MARATSFIVKAISFSSRRLPEMRGTGWGGDGEAGSGRLLGGLPVEIFMLGLTAGEPLAEICGCGICGLSKLPA